ncbi:MAG: RecX family transcriptional regulator [Bacteroidia bacterium]|nr:RecX family transcriptional regulator [Bacteroidia bacterium]
MSEPLTEEQALAKVESYCSSSEHCSAEIADKLKKWGISYDAVERLLARLKADRFIDDERYCRAFVNDKFRFSKWGKMKIAQGLYLKKIPSEMAWRYLNEIDETSYQEVLRQLLDSKRKSIRASSDYELNVKLMRFALGRGFEQKDVNRYLTVSVNEEEFDD